MADIFDTAQAFRARLNSDAESRARGKSAPETHPDFNGLNCVDCGDAIHPARLALGKVRCFECQDFLERGGSGDGYGQGRAATLHGGVGLFLRRLTGAVVQMNAADVIVITCVIITAILICRAP